MRIDESLCIGCGQCVPYCPMGAIALEAVATIDRDACVECGACFRSRICPVDAFVEEVPEWPRAIRYTFSNPSALHVITGLPGRGTEEMKTNEVTGRFQPGFVGIGLEFGRPVKGTTFRELEKAAKVLARVGAHFEPKNPVTVLMDVNTGEFNKDVLDEKAMTAIIECLVPVEKFEEAIAALKEVAKEINTVFSVEVISRCKPDGSVPLEPILDKLNLRYSPWGKTCVGLGRPLAKGGSR